MAKWKVVVTDWEYADLLFEKRVLLQHEEIELVPAQCRTEEEVIAACRDADGIINQYAPLSRAVLERLEACKVITRYGVGVNTVDLEAATERGICVANVPDYCMDEVSDHALALLLDATRKVSMANRHVKNGRWDFKVTQPIYRLRGRTIGLVAFGKIPRALTPKVQALGLQVIAYDPYIDERLATERGVQLVSMEELCRRADFISVHAPLTEETRGMLSTEQFLQMKSDAVVINTARGPVIDEEALVTALQTGQIGGAALDVIEEEPMVADHPLRTMDNVVLTPHVAWYSEESAAEMRLKAALGIVDVLVHGEFPKYLVNENIREQVRLRDSEPGMRYEVGHFVTTTQS